MVWSLEESAKPKLDRRREGTGIVKEQTNTRLKVKYSYYVILILDTVQLIVNSSPHTESYRKSQKHIETYYVILRHATSY